MAYFDSRANVEEYIKLTNGYDGRQLVAALAALLPAGSSVLELGMGPGKDLDLLSHHFRVTGSDSSRPFLERYRAVHPDADLLQLDACELNTDRRFDAIYSNKVLCFLSRDELRHSLVRQSAILRSGGLMFHSFFRGDGEETVENLRWIYYEKHHLQEILDETDHLEAVAMEIYQEMEDADSLYLVARTKSMDENGHV